MSKLSDLIKAAKARTAQIPANPAPIIPLNQPTESNPESNLHIGIDRYGNEIEWNEEQWKFIELAANGKSAILIGAAGTGKTTTMRGSIQKLLQTNYFPPINEPHKHLPSDTPGIAAISYTRRAVMNLRRAMPVELQNNCITIHKLLEYQPVFYEVYDEALGEYRKTMKFEPNRNAYNPLPHNIKTIIIDESSMVSVDLFHKIWTAIDPAVRPTIQFIFLGDIQQLPPVFGSAILGYKMLKLPTIELIQVYRQALESPIIRLAHRILSGNPIPHEEYQQWEIPNQLKLHPWKKKISADHALNTIANFCKKAWDSGDYNPDTDMILIPFNKAVGTDELNKHIANHIARRTKRKTFEVIAGFNKHYFSIGEKVLYEKEDAEIISIERNRIYAGKWPQKASEYLDYWGCLQETEEQELDHHIEDSNDEMNDADVDAMLEAIANSDVEDRVHEASHVITVRIIDSGAEVEIKSAAGINALIMSYSLTGHKAQGSEWRKVYLMLHHTHNTLVQREWLYTAITRAREELYVICEPDTFTKGILNQRIKGNSLADKTVFFQGKLEAGEESLLAEVL